MSKKAIILSSVAAALVVLVAVSAFFLIKDFNAPADTQPIEQVKLLTDIQKLSDAGQPEYKTHYVYDEAGRVSFIDNVWYWDSVYEQRADLTYDDTGKLIWNVSSPPYAQSAPGENAGTQYTYNELGQLVSRMDWEGGITKENFEYDSTGKLIHSYCDYDAVIYDKEYVYDVNGHLESIRQRETYLPGTANEEVAETIYYYSCDAQGRILTEKFASPNGFGDSVTVYDYSYWPIVTVEQTAADGYKSHLLELRNSDDLVLDTIQLDDPLYFADNDGYLSRILDRTSSEEPQIYIYEFSYNDTLSQPIHPVSSVDFFWEDFLTSGDYQQYITSAVDATALQYATWDLDGDGITELLLCCAQDQSRYNTWLFTYSGTKNVPVIEHTDYAPWQYSPSQGAVVLSNYAPPAEPNNLFSYFRLINGNLEPLLQIQTYDGKAYLLTDDDSSRLRKKEYNAYFSDIIDFDWQPVPKVKISYTVEQIEQMVAAHFQANNPEAGTFVVFSEETTVDGQFCEVVVRIQQADATIDTGANLLVAAVKVNMDTGMAILDLFYEKTEIRLFEVS